MQIEREEEQPFQVAVNCDICGFELGADRVRTTIVISESFVDLNWELIVSARHCHLRKFRGAAHNDCNLNYSFTRRIPVILHNLSVYDSHLIMQGLGQDKMINCIPNNTEKYISFSIINLDFIDSLQFMNASLKKLVSNLAKDSVDKFPTLARHINSNKVPLLLKKGVYNPYAEHISDEDYAHATTTSVFNSFACQNMA